MGGVGQRERATQNRIVKLFRDRLEYIYLGKLHDQANKNIDEGRLREYLHRQGYSPELIRRAINLLLDVVRIPDLYYANQGVYGLLRYGAAVKEDASVHTQTVKFINWEEPYENDFYLAEEVTIIGAHAKRPDLVLYVNGIAMAVIELKRSIVSVSEGIRQNLDNQSTDFIRPFFATIQLVMAGNDTEGLRYGVIDTAEKYYMEWKEDQKATDPLSPIINGLIQEEGYKIDKNLISLCHKERFLDIIHNFIVFDSGRKKICRHNHT